MREREHTDNTLDGCKLKPAESAVFPSNWLVRTDKPEGLVAHHNGLVGFENTNVIIRICGTSHECPSHRSPLCILFASEGIDSYDVDGRRFMLDERSYLILNLGQTVGCSFRLPIPMTSYTIGFWPGFAEEVLRGLITPDDVLLDNPGGSDRQPVRFFDQLYPHDEIISPQLAHIRFGLEHEIATRGWLEDQHHILLKRMLLVHRQVGKEIERLPAIRAATRSELYQRLHRARDFMEASLEQPLTIPQIAQAAWFSPHHFLRQFKQAFGETPHQYLTRRRLERAQLLLRKTEMRVGDICFQVGFESLGSFSWLFRQRIGCSPEQFRLEQRKSQIPLAPPDPCLRTG